MDRVGCEKCWSSDAAAAWDTVTQTEIQTYLVDESHFIVSIRACSTCSQQFLQVTTETIDWQDGDDPIYRAVIPINANERAELESSKPISNSMLESIGRDRRSLKYGWPKGEEPCIHWGNGVYVGFHD